MAKKRSTATADKVTEPKPPFSGQKLKKPGLEKNMKDRPRWKGERYRPAGKLEGQAALVTGGDSGIGRSVAYHFAREGADVAIVCLPEEEPDAQEVQNAIEELGRTCLVLLGDLRDKEFCDEIVERTEAELGRLDVLVHNAAWQNRKNIEDLSEEDLDRTIRTNVYAYLRLARAAVPRMSEGSSIISTGSIVGLSGSERLSDYGATKGAIHSITKSLAAELMDKGIRVNCVAPGPVWTPLNPADKGTDSDDIRNFGKEAGHSPMERPAQPEELAPAFVFLASNADSSYITGIVLPVTGGKS
jgi:NAD(P)-dependent dehydrogenase (short-subunit alcohol dehydrogenase family)